MSLVKAKQLEGVHANQLLDNLITAIVDPTVSQDISQGYKPSSIWVNVNASPHKVFICSDNSIGAAVWIEIKELPVAPSSTPLGYNDIRTSFTGANWDYEGLTNNGGGISLTGSIAVSGAAGWRYLVVDTLGVVSVETIPPAEIIADTQQFTPAPIFSVANNGYYSSVNPTYRIIAIGFFDGANILETISYANSSNKNDDYWYSLGNGVSTITVNDRLQFTDPFVYSRGTNITCVDNGAGNTDSEGFRVTANKNGKIKISVNVEIYGEVNIAIYKNGTLIFEQINSSGIGNILEYFEDFCQKNDYYTFVVMYSQPSSLSCIIRYPKILFEEF